MANHAYVVPRGRFPTVKQIQKDVKDIIDTRFPELAITYDEKSKHWWIGAKDDEHFGVQFWIDKYDLHPLDEENQPDYEKPSRKKSCIEFRHGHSYEILWWLEHEIREELAVRYDAWSIDDGSGDYCKPDKRRYNTYAEYYIDVYKHVVKSHPEYVNVHFGIFRPTIPPSMAHYFGEDLKIEVVLVGQGSNLH